MDASLVYKRPNRTHFLKAIDLMARVLRADLVELGLSIKKGVPGAERSPVVVTSSNPERRSFIEF
jgi:hypothetical protein